MVAAYFYERKQLLGNFFAAAIEPEEPYAACRRIADGDRFGAGVESALRRALSLYPVCIILIVKKIHPS